MYKQNTNAVLEPSLYFPPTDEQVGNSSCLKPRGSWKYYKNPKELALGSRQSHCNNSLSQQRVKVKGSGNWVEKERSFSKEWILQRYFTSRVNTVKYLIFSGFPDKMSPQPHCKEEKKTFHKSRHLYSQQAGSVSCPAFSWIVNNI